MRAVLVTVLGIVAFLAGTAIVAVLAGILQAGLPVLFLNALQLIAAICGIVGVTRRQPQLARIGTTSVGILWALESITGYLTSESDASATATGLFAALITIVFVVAGQYAGFPKETATSDADGSTFRS